MKTILAVFLLAQFQIDGVSALAITICFWGLTLLGTIYLTKSPEMIRKKLNKKYGPTQKSVIGVFQFLKPLYVNGAVDALIEDRAGKKMRVLLSSKIGSNLSKGKIIAMTPKGVRMASNHEANCFSNDILKDFTPQPKQQPLHEIRKEDTVEHATARVMVNA